jgi:hypothetical protein
MSDEIPKQTRRFDPTNGAGLPWPIVVGLLGFVGAGSGAGGSLVTGNTVAGELREFRVEVRAELARLGGALDKLDAHDERIRRLELELATMRGSGSRKD